MRALGDEPLHRELPPLYARNGPAVLALRVDGLAERGLYGGDVRALRDGPCGLDRRRLVVRPQAGRVAPLETLTAPDFRTLSAECSP